MLDLILDAVEAIFGEGSDVMEALSGVADGVDIGDALLIGSAIYVANLTVSSIQDELRNRRELKAKGATQVIIKDFINQNGYTEVSFAALNAQNKQIGTFSMKGRSCSGLHKGQRIAI